MLSPTAFFNQKKTNNHLFSSKRDKRKGARGVQEPFAKAEETPEEQEEKPEEQYRTNRLKTQGYNFWLTWQSI